MKQWIDSWRKKKFHTANARQLFIVNGDNKLRNLGGRAQWPWSLYLTSFARFFTAIWRELSLAIDLWRTMLITFNRIAQPVVLFYFGCPRQTHWTASSTGPLWPRMFRHWRRFHLSFQIEYWLQLASICHLRVNILRTAPDTGRHRLDIRPHCAIGLVAKINRWKQSEAESLIKGQIMLRLRLKCFKSWTNLSIVWSRGCCFSRRDSRSPPTKPPVCKWLVLKGLFSRNEINNKFKTLFWKWSGDLAMLNLATLMYLITMMTLVHLIE